MNDNNSSKFVVHPSIALCAAESFLSDIRKYSLKEVISNKINGLTSREQLEPIFQNDLYKFRFRCYRIIAKDLSKELKEGGIDFKDTFLLLRILHKADGIYGALTAANPNRRRMDQALNQLYGAISPSIVSDVDRLIKEYKEEKAPPPLEDFPDQYLEWIQTPKWTSPSGYYDYTICESQYWIKHLAHDYLSSLHSLIEEIMTANPKQGFLDDLLESHDLRGRNNIRFVMNDGCAIFFSLVRDDEFERDLLFLIKPFYKKYNNKELAELYRKELEENQSFRSLAQKEDLTGEDILKESYRAYPFDIFGGKNGYENWKKIESEQEANLALSREEELLLNQVTSSHSQSKNLPIFINGRAGSGKSTMLLHLLSIYLNKKLYSNTAGRILYLTYTRNLMENAKRIERNILTTNYHVFFTEENQEQEEDYKERINHLLTTTFYTFYDLLIRLLPYEKKKRFLEYRRRITFSDFSESFYSKKITDPQVTNRVSPETAWHVIRSYIKGREHHQYLSAEEYDTIARVDKSVTKEIYQVVYDSIWNAYCNYLEEEERWDDQDLVREVLQYMDEPTFQLEDDYLAIFCDEAQDFTKIELNFILRLSAYSKYNLDRVSKIECLPLVFAGDPLQTITPTGFNWDRFKEMLYNEIESTFHLKDPQRFLTDCKQDLLYNYRSSHNIVKCSNAIQFLRRVLFDEQVLPQKTWFNGSEAMPSLFILKDKKREEEFIMNADDTLIIAPYPCVDLENVKKDNLLERIREKHSDVGANDDFISTIFTALIAKGLEFDKVIVYKFGDYLEEDLLKSLERNHSKEDFKLKYFLNRLYVAVTRAKKHLIVVDTEKGMKYLWNHLRSDSLKILDPQEYDKWEKDNREWIPFLESSSASEMKEENPLKNAIHLKEQGILQENVTYLKKAKSIYEKLDEYREAKTCEAWCERLNENYKKAGLLFEELEEEEMARDCFWEGEYWGNLLGWYDRKIFHKDFKYTIVDFMVTNREEKPHLKADKGIALIRNYERLKDDPNLLHSKQFMHVKEELLSFLEDKRDSLAEDQLQTIVEELEKNQGLFADVKPRYLNLLLSIYKDMGAYETVISMVEDYDLDKDDDYYRAKAEVELYPESLQYLFKLNDNSKIISLYEEKKEKIESATILNYVALSYNKVGEIYKASDVFYELGDEEAMAEILKNNREKIRGDFNQDFFYQYFQLVFKKSELDDTLFKLIDKTFYKDEEKQVELYKYIFHLMASSSYTKDTIILSHNDVNKIFEKTREWVYDTDQWSMNVIEASLSYERLDAKYGPLIGYYEKLMKKEESALTGAGPEKIRRQLQSLFGKDVDIYYFLRSRWYVYKIKFAESSRVMNEKDKELDKMYAKKKLKEWNLKEEEIIKEMPILNREISDYPEEIDNRETITLSMKDGEFSSEKVFGGLKRRNRGETVDTIEVKFFAELFAHQLKSITVETDDLQLIIRADGDSS